MCIEVLIIIASSLLTSICIEKRYQGGQTHAHSYKLRSYSFTHTPVKNHNKGDSQSQVGKYSITSIYIPRAQKTELVKHSIYTRTITTPNYINITPQKPKGIKINDKRQYFTKKRTRRKKVVEMSRCNFFAFPMAWSILGPLMLQIRQKLPANTQKSYT